MELAVDPVIHPDSGLYLHQIIGGLGFGQHPRLGIQEGDGRRSQSQEPVRLLVDGR